MNMYPDTGLTLCYVIIHAEEFEKTSVKDFLPILMTLVKVVVVVLILGTGNLLLMGGAFYAYRQYTSRQKEKEMREQGLY
jgi:uncharacterized protein HemY